jgi:hypothetical protein
MSNQAKYRAHLSHTKSIGGVIRSHTADPRPSIDESDEQHQGKKHLQNCSSESNRNHLERKIFSSGAAVRVADQVRCFHVFDGLAEDYKPVDDGYEDKDGNDGKEDDAENLHTADR